jgi:hypothetical protein
MNLDRDKLYTKLIALDEIYNFVVQTFSFEVILWLKKLIYYPDRDTGNQIWTVYQFFESRDDFKRKSLNYKVVHLVKSYTFCIKFISIRVHIKKLRFF